MSRQPEKYLEKLLDGEFSDQDYRDLINLAKYDPAAAEILADVRFLIDVDTMKSQTLQQVTPQVENQAEYLKAKIDLPEMETEELHDTFKEIEDPEQLSIREKLTNSFWTWILIRFNMFPVPPDFFEKSTEKIKINLIAPFKPAIIVALILILSFYFLNTDSQDKIEKEIVHIPTYTRSENQASVIELSNEVNLVMAGNSTFKRHSETLITLKKGSLWLDVEKEGAGFEVDTDYGLVKVTGTSFGVSKVQNEIIIEVAEGTVLFIRDGKTSEIPAGKYLAAELENISELNDRIDGEHIPLWVKKAQVEHWIENLPSLVAYWDMEEVVDQGNTNLVLDKGPHGIHGRATGLDEGPSFTQDSPDTDIFGKAAHFSSVKSDRIELGPQEILTKLYNNYTVMAWIKRGEDRASYDRIIGSGWRSWGFGFQEEMLDMRIPYSSDSKTKINDEHTIEIPRDIAGQWVHVACTFKDGLLEMFLNGKNIGSKNITGYRPADRNPDPYWAIGTTMRLDTEIRSQFEGGIDEVRIYSETLNAETIRRISKIDLLHSKKSQTQEGETSIPEAK